MSNLAGNIRRVRERIHRAARRGGRDPGLIEMVAVTKGVAVSTIQEAIDEGITTLGENRVQEASLKCHQIARRVSWHLVGHLQTNKARRAVEIFDLIHSVDTFRLAQEVDKRARGANKIQKILIQVNTSGEQSKFGASPAEVADLAQKVAPLENVQVLGLMTIGPFTSDLEEVRPSFQRLRALAEEIASEHIPGVEMRYLSMGMTDDFEVAIEEGATMVRIGRAIFQ